MIRRLLPLILAGALVASGCISHLGRRIPGCGGDEINEINNAIILTAQSVRGSAYVPCISELKPGWQYEHLEARTGQTRFWISSDRVGERFLEVTFTGSCDLTGAAETPSDELGIRLFVEEIEADFYVPITVIPEGGGQDYLAYALEVAQDIGAMKVGNRLVSALIDSTDLPTAERIRLSLAEGQAVFVVGAQDYEEHTVELHFLAPGDSVPTVLPGLSAREAVRKVGEPLGDPHYRAVWHYSFQNGCVTYRIDATGLGADRISYEIKDALGFLLLAPLREYGESVGFNIP